MVRTSSSHGHGHPPLPFGPPILREASSCCLVYLPGCSPCIYWQAGRQAGRQADRQSGRCQGHHQPVGGSQRYHPFSIRINGPRHTRREAASTPAASGGGSSGVSQPPKDPPQHGGDDEDNGNDEDDNDTFVVPAVNVEVEAGGDSQTSSPRSVSSVIGCLV